MMLGGVCVFAAGVLSWGRKGRCACRDPAGRRLVHLWGYLRHKPHPPPKNHPRGRPAPVVGAPVGRRGVLPALHEVVEGRHVDARAAAVALAAKPLADVHLACGGEIWEARCVAVVNALPAKNVQRPALPQIRPHTAHHSTPTHSKPRTGGGRRELPQAVGVARLELALVPVEGRL